MDILLLQLQTALREKISFARNQDICLIPNPGVIPEVAGMPYIGIKDGNVNIHELMDDVLEKELLVEIYIYDRLEHSDKNILGLHEKGRQVSEVLRNYYLPGHIDTAQPKSEMPVVLLYTKKGLVIRKGLQFQYEKEE